MASFPTITFAAAERPESGVALVLAGDGLALGPVGQAIEAASEGVIAAAAGVAKFKGKAEKTLTIPVPRGTSLDKLTVVGIGTRGDLSEFDLVKIGGAAAGALGSATEATVVLEAPGEDGLAAADVAAIVLGMALRIYAFDRYKTKKDGEGEGNGEAANGEGNGEGAGTAADKAPRTLKVAVSDPVACEAAWARHKAAAEGVWLARDLVNEPANVLGPVEFADRMGALRDLGVEVEVMDVPAMERLGMRALLGVAQGSARPARVVKMTWKGGKADAAPVVVVGKGVVFDSGGISIKPASGMEDMKGDMAGAATVAGLMHTLAARKAPAHVVGLIGLVENMPDGNAQRPGDVVTSMSGQTIEIINTDAEGRLVLADLLHWAATTMKPRAMVNLATLTGAIIVALGHTYAGMFTQDEKLAGDLRKAGEATGDLVWPMPLAKAYDKLIDSKIADMKNTGGRWAGSITAAQFLRRFVGETSWAHLDIAGTGMGAPSSAISRTFGTGFGVRLLDRWIEDNHQA